MEDYSDDPIARSLKEREAAGGINERRPQTAAPGGRPNKPKDIEEEKKGAKPTTAPKDRPQTAKVSKPEEEKKVGPTKPTTIQPGKKPVPAAAKDEGDADDPIARSLAERTKAGSISAVVGSKTAPAPTKPQAKPPAIDKKPVPAAAPSKTEGDTEDPIAKSLSERTKAGSISDVISSKPIKPQPKPPATEKKPPAATSEAKKPEDAKKPEKPADKKPVDEEKKKVTAAKASEESKGKPKDEKKPTNEKPGEKKDDKKPEIKVTSTRPAEEKKSEPKKLVG